MATSHKNGKKRKSSAANMAASRGQKRSRTNNLDPALQQSDVRRASISSTEQLDSSDGDQSDPDKSGEDEGGVSPSSPSPATGIAPAMVQQRPPTVVANFVRNQFVASKTRVWTPVIDPATQRLLGRVPETTVPEVHDVVASAKMAYEEWRKIPLSVRRKPLFRLIDLIHDRESELTDAICLETGKTANDARSEIARSINMIEAALSVSSTILGYHFANESTESHTINEPLGVCLAVTSFNFPLMIPMWVIPFAIATGNTLILKPSEQCPLAISILAGLFTEAEFPPGVFSLVHGGPPVVDRLLAEEDIRAVSFVGGDRAGHHIYKTAIAAGKRCQANCGAKNHGVVLSDANKEITLRALAASAFGAAGQRCQGLSVAVFVGDSIEWLPDLVEIAKSLPVGSGLTPGTVVGPLISRVAKKKVENAIQSAFEDGASILLDGRGVKVPQFSDGNFVGPTIIANVQAHMPCYQNEIFGPVLVCIHAETLSEAIEILNDNKYGNGCSIFTTSALHAQRFQQDVNIGRIGINVPILASSGQMSNSSNKDSFLGDINVHGFKGFGFFTHAKTVTSIWR